MTGAFDGYAWGENIGWIHLRSTIAPTYGMTVLTGSDDRGGGETPINGGCGNANGQTLTSTPISGFCNTGTASTLSGSGTWSCASSGGGSTANCSASLDKMNQTLSAISFNPATLAVGGATIASASSGLTVTFTSQTTNVCTVSSATVTGITAGICTITANQAGNTRYNPAPPVTQNLTVTEPAATVRLTVTSVPAGITYGSDCSESYPANTAVTLTATARRQRLRLRSLLPVRADG